MIPQLVLLFLVAVSLGISAGKNGEPQGNYSFFTTLISDAIVIALLWWGGFFDVFVK